MYSRLVYETQLAQTATSFPYALELSGQFVIQVKAKRDAGLDAIEDLVWQELHTLRENGCTESELAKAKNRYEAGYLKSMMTSQSRADALNGYRVFFKDTAGINAQLDRIRGVNCENIREVAGYLVESSAVVLNWVRSSKKNRAS